MNPYITQTADALRAQSNQNLMQSVIPGINRGAIATGGYGGSRNAIAQGVAAGNAQAGLDSTIAGMYSQAYESDQNRAMQANALAQQMEMAKMNDATQRLGIGNQYTLGLGNLGLGFQNANQNYALGLGNLGLGYFNANNNYNLGLGGLQNQATANQQNFYTAQRGQDLQAQNQGFNQYLGGLNAQLGMGQNMANIGQQQYQAGLNPLTAYGSLISPFTGLNGSTSQSVPNQGGGAMGAVGGALTAAQLAQLLGLFGG